MKKVFSILTVLILAFAIISCGSSAKSKKQERTVPAGFPEFVKKAILNAPEDVLVGVGNAKLASLSQSRTISTNRARAEISRQMVTIIQDMIRDYQASSEVDPAAALSFQENITVSLSKATLQGATVVDQDIDADGQVWTVVFLGKTNVAQEINQAQAAARLAIPAMASFSAEDRMNAAFDRVNNQEIRVGSN